jgi:hypothetical protein
MRRTSKILSTAALLLGTTTVGATSLPASQSARAVTPGRFVSGWIPNWSPAVVTDGTSALLSGQGAVFADVSPFGFSATGAGTIATSGSETSLATAVSALRANGLPVLPSITDGTGRLVMAGILADPGQRAQHVAAITNLVVGRGYDGIDLDYEGFAFTDGQASWPTTRPNWATFVIELGASLHANGKLLSVTVPPIWKDGSAQRGYSVYSWHERTAGLDILPAIDRLRLMVYDWSVGLAGPVSPIEWVDKVLSFVKSAVPASDLRKVQMGVPTYGRSWAKVLSGSCPANAPIATVAVQMENVGGLVAKEGAVVERDPSGELKLIYDEVFTGSGTSSPPPAYSPPADPTDDLAPADPGGLQFAVRLGGATCVVRRTVYFPDVVTVVQRANAALAAGLSGIAIWALGYETDDLWAHLAGIDVDRPPGSTPIGSLDLAVRVGNDLRVAGWVMDPEFDLPVTFTVSATGVGQSSGAIIARTHRGDLPFADKLHGFDLLIPMTVAQGATVCITATGYGFGTSPTHFCTTAG